jgi:hypothetical protein
VFAEETWPEVRAEWLHSAIAADDRRVDDAAMSALIEHGHDEDIVAAFVALRFRGADIPVGALDLLVAHDSSRAVLSAGIGILRFTDEIPRAWLEGVQESPGYSERLQPMIDALLQPESAPTEP